MNFYTLIRNIHYQTHESIHVINVKVGTYLIPFVEKKKHPPEEVLFRIWMMFRSVRTSGRLND